MTSNIDLNNISKHSPSMCIPRVFPNIDEKRIRQVFNELNLGSIFRIDIVRKEAKFNRVFIHFNNWNNNSNANKARITLLNGKEIKIIYDEPWFWKISAYREPKLKIYQKPKVSILFEEESKETKENKEIKLIKQSKKKLVIEEGEIMN